jgi:hypothetical protein
MVQAKRQRLEFHNALSHPYRQLALQKDCILQAHAPARFVSGLV